MSKPVPMDTSHSRPPGVHEMAEGERNVLRFMQSFLVANMDPDPVLLPLELEGVLSHHNVEVISAKETPADRCRALLNILPSRGASAFHKFVECLIQAGQMAVADTLREQVVELARLQTTSRPTHAPDDSAMDHSGAQGGSGDYGRCETRYQRQPFVPADAVMEMLYPGLAAKAKVTYKPTFSVLMINFWDYSHESKLPKLPSNVSDIARLRQCLNHSDLFQLTPVLQDVSKEMLVKNVRIFADHLALTDGVLVVVFGHATEDATFVYTCKKEPVNISHDIVKPVVHCQELSGRPKIFLFVLTAAPSRRKSDLPPVYRNLADQCLYLVSRNDRPGPNQKKEKLLSVFCQSSKEMDANEASYRGLMERLVTSVKDSVDIVNTFRM